MSGEARSTTFEIQIGQTIIGQVEFYYASGNIIYDRYTSNPHTVTEGQNNIEASTKKGIISPTIGKLMFVKAGSFNVGAPEPTGAFPGVILTKNFFMGETEVTQKQYLK